jgi:branched-chain amino acid transport system substrate-binding protein
MRGTRERFGLVVMLVVVAIVAAGALAACGSSGNSTSTASPTAPIVIGEMNSLTGNSAAPAKTLQQGFDLEIAAVNAAGGINGRQIKVITLDDKSDMSAAVAGMTQLIQQDKVSAIIGPFPQTVATAARSIAEKAGVPQIDYAPPTLDDLKNTSYKWSFLAAAGPDGVADALIQAAAKQGYKKIVAIADVLPIHQQSLEIMKTTAPAAGLDLTVLKDSWTLDTTDMSPIVAKIAAAAKAQKPDALYILSNPISVPSIQKGLKALGVTTPVIGSAAGTSPAIFLQGPPAVEGFMAIGPGITNPSELPEGYAGKAEMLDFVQRFQAKYNAPPDFYAGFGYDTVHLLVNAMKAAGGDDKAKVRDAIEATKGWAGTGGIFTYSPTDHVGIHGGFDLWIVKGGQFKLVTQLNPDK